MASDGKNCELAQRWMDEVWNQRREEVVDELESIGWLRIHSPADGP